MKTKKNTMIAAVTIAMLMTSLFILFQLVISKTGITLMDGGNVLITPPEPTQFAGSETTAVPVEEQEYLPGVFSTGMPVVINGTDGAGLRVRMESGLESAPLFLGAEGEAFKIIAGPAIKDSLVWWKVESISDPTRTGWAVQDYLVFPED